MINTLRSIINTIEITISSLKQDSEKCHQVEHKKK